MRCVYEHTAGCANMLGPKEHKDNRSSGVLLEGDNANRDLPSGKQNKKEETPKGKKQQYLHLLT